MMTLLVGCAKNTNAIDDYINNAPIVIDMGCAWVSKITVSKNDVLTGGTGRQIYNHNKALERNCKK